jgi:hypothetical protein
MDAKRLTSIVSDFDLVEIEDCFCVGLNSCTTANLMLCEKGGAIEFFLRVRESGLLM